MLIYFRKKIKVLDEMTNIVTGKLFIMNKVSFFFLHLHLQYRIQAFMIYWLQIRRILLYLYKHMFCSLKKLKLGMP